MTEPPSSNVVGDGLVVVDKACGMTSHDVVARLRRMCGTRKVGHAGTLDPMATGVLVIGVNRGTRLLSHLVLSDKAYTATIRLGQSTITDDADGEVISTVSAAATTEADVLAALPALTGDIEQVPSSVSAIKVAGRRSYARVRAGEEVILPPRAVHVRRFDAVGFARPSTDLLDVDVAVDCSSGTYVRALARDLGDALDVGGHLTALRRTRVGPFAAGDSRSLDELQAGTRPIVMALSEAISRVMPVRRINGDDRREIGFGRSIAGSGLDGTYGLLDVGGSAVALVQERDGRAHPVLVFAPAG